MASKTRLCLDRDKAGLVDQWSPDGYPALSLLMAKGDETTVFRRFHRMSIRSLLYQQSALYALENQADALDLEDEKSTGGREAAKIYQSFASATDAQAKRRRRLYDEVDSRLSKYHNALILHSKVLQLSSPSQRSLQDFRQWWKSRYPPILSGNDENLYDSVEDIVTLKSYKDDRMLGLIRRLAGWIFIVRCVLAVGRRTASQDRELDAFDTNHILYKYSEAKLQTAATVATTILSAAALIGPIATLTAIATAQLWTKVGVVIIYMGLFASVVGLLTAARRVEVFAGTAAYAAVLVVFISSTN